MLTEGSHALSLGRDMAIPPCPPKPLPVPFTSAGRTSVSSRWLCAPRAGIISVCHTPLLPWCWKSNCSTHDYIASTLLTEPFPWPVNTFLINSWREDNPSLVKESVTLRTHVFFEAFCEHWLKGLELEVWLVRLASTDENWNQSNHSSM